jgi:hypothetical protein
LNVILNALKLKSDNEARKAHHQILRRQDELLKLMKEIKANFEFERTFSLEGNREKKREQKYLEWKKIGFGEKSSPRKVAELEAFLARKLQENLAEEARREHLDEITSRL